MSVSCAQPGRDSTSQKQARLVADLLGSGSPYRVRWDNFQLCEVLEVEGKWVPVDEARVTALHVQLCDGTKLSRRTFKQILHMVAQENAFDSAEDWLVNLPKWDGVDRVEQFLSVYLGTKVGDYESAVSLYIWTAMVARILRPGCKADMVPVLVGPQGSGKSSALLSLTPSTAQFTDVRLTDRSSELARKVVGKIVVAWEELRGIRGKVDADEVKAFITNPYIELPATRTRGMDRYDRRFILFGTTNRMDFLRDPTGHRRYLPFDVGRVALSKLEGDREQLWAEALALVHSRLTAGKSPVCYEGAEQLAVARHTYYLNKAEWTDDEQLLNWLSLGQDRFRTSDALRVVGVIDPSKKQSTEMTKTLQQLGYIFKQTRTGAGKVKLWHRPKDNSTVYNR